ncbi:unnamed protein product [Meloidogyne enterolobii]|uniref:Uncharacterized protein n=1 Tax=Meloidogyne enterolobii TaxID=390850 RepID=A0ACB0YHD8_MELEN
MHGQFGFKSPHGPCIICFLTKSNKSLSISLSGILALIPRFSTSSELVTLSISNMVKSRWMCGSPRPWFSTGYIQQSSLPKILVFVISVINAFTFR